MGLLPEKNLFDHSIIMAKVIDYEKEINFMDAQMRVILIAETIQQDDLLGKKVVFVIDYSGITLSFLLKLNFFALQRTYSMWKVGTHLA